MRSLDKSPHVARAELVELLRRTAARDAVAFNQVYRRTYDKLLRVVLVVVPTREDAEDVLQDVFAKIWKGAGDFDPGRASPISWMVTIARNASIDLVRSRRMKTVELEDDICAVDSDRDEALDELFNGRERSLVIQVLRQLPPLKQELLSLAYIRGKSRKQLAKRFGVPVGTVKTWLRRTLQMLEQAVADQRNVNGCELERARSPLRLQS